MRHTELTLDVATVGALGRHMPPRESGFLVPTQEPLELGASALVNLMVGSRRVQLTGEIVEVAVNATRLRNAPHIARVQLDRRSWKRLFMTVCHATWRRREDLAGAKRGRTPLSAPTPCLVDADGQVHEAKLVEVSASGAFVAMPDLDVACGDILRFRADHDMSWHQAEVRWRGTKHHRDGIGLQLSFDSSEEQQAWLGVLASARAGGA